MPEVPESPRAAKYLIERVKDLLSHLRISQTFLLELDLDNNPVDESVAMAKAYQHKLQAVAAQRIDTRGRFKKQIRPEGQQPDRYFLFLDECGSHVTSHIDDKFPFFCVAGVIVKESEYEAFDVTWKAWKTKHLGSPTVVSHEPDLRSNSRKFRRSDPLEKKELKESLDQVLMDLDYHTIAAVVDLREFKRLHPESEVDEFLPRSCYLIAIDFIMERFVHFLQYAGNDARGLVIAESRGLKEDAIVHAEYINLHIRGTQFMSESDFRHQLRPYIEFYRKKRNSSGLQIADLAARPLAEIARDPASTPERWDVFRSKLYDGMKAAPHSYGLKVFPLTEVNDPFPELPRKAKGNTNRVPSAD